MIFLSVILKFMFPLSCSQFFNVFQNAFTLGQSTNKCLIDSIACSQKEHLLLSILLILCKNELVKGHFANCFSGFNIQYSDIFC